jgi:DNA replication and repair protein RecF
MAGSGDPPVLLVDDIVSELDQRRRRSVLDGLAGFDQVWFTASSGASLPDDFVEGCAVFNVQGGQVTPV